MREKSCTMGHPSSRMQPTDQHNDIYIYDFDRLNLLNIDNDNHKYIYLLKFGRSEHFYHELMTNILQFIFTISRKCEKIAEREKVMTRKNLSIRMNSC